MTPREFQIETERRLQIIDPTLINENKLTSDAIFSLLNEAKDKFFKTRYSGINAKGQGFEQSQKRIDDLRTLIRTKKYQGLDIAYENNISSVTLPDDYVILLGDTAGITPVTEKGEQCWEKVNDIFVTKYTDTLESTIETIDRQLQNSLSEHRLKYSSARPIKLIKDNKILLYSDGNYKVSEYQIDYLSTPSKLDVKQLALVEYTDLPEHTHIEIVKIAVQIYCATRALQNYNSISSEVNNME